MTQWRWVPFEVLHVIHDRQIARHGGAPGLRDTALLEMGVARALNRANYEPATVFEIAAAYAFGVTKAHAFVDGNKRTGFVAALTFLRLNGFAVRTDPATGVVMMDGLALGAATETEFAVWLEHDCHPMDP